MADTLTQIVRADLEAFMARRDNELFFNEGDFQLHLALYLRLTGHYDDVDIEYYVPYTELDNYIWKNELYLDVVVRRGCEYIPIELKYPTDRVLKNIKRFGEEMPCEVEVVKHQGAQDLVAYNFWKDVRRIELVKRRFPAVSAGFAVLLTNDTSYMRPRRPDSNCVQMCTNAGKYGLTRHWLREASITRDKPNFEVDREYIIEWHPCSLDGHPFNYCIIQV